MMNNYIKRAALLLSAAAILGTGSAFAEGAWRNINHKVKNVSCVDGWNGVITATADNLAEVWSCPGMTYQVIPDVPAGEYTLKFKAFYRCADAPSAAKARRDGKEVLAAEIFFNDSKVTVKSLFDRAGVTIDQLLTGDEYNWGLVPNSTGEARAAFDNGEYVNTITIQHPGGDLYFGIRNYGNLQRTGFDEWMCYGDPEITGPNGAVEIKNPTFQGWSKDEGWDMENIANSAKGRGVDQSKGRSVFSKTNGSPYIQTQTLTGLPAGKYRFTIQAFNCHFLGSYNGYYLPMKGQFKEFVGKSAKDMYEEGATEYPMGQASGNEDVYTPKGYVNVEDIEAYVFMCEGERPQFGFDEGTNHNYWLDPWEDEDTGETMQVNGKEVVIKNLFDEKLDQYPDCNNYKVNGEWYYQNADGTPMWFESGHEREVAALFIAHPELYQNTVEMEFDGDNNTITFGTRKDVNQNNYWQPSFDWRLEYYDPTYTGYVPASASQSGVEDIFTDTTVDENAPVEYYNLQGVKVNVENAAPGLYIVKQGKKVTKTIIR